MIVTKTLVNKCLKTKTLIGLCDFVCANTGNARINYGTVDVVSYINYYEVLVTAISTICYKYNGTLHSIKLCLILIYETV